MSAATGGSGRVKVEGVARAVFEIEEFSYLRSKLQLFASPDDEPWLTRICENLVDFLLFLPGLVRVFRRKFF